MRTIFSKVNSERLPEYRIITKIVEDASKKRYAVKSPLSEKAKTHLSRMVSNYELLANNFSVNIVKPIRKGENLIFEFAEGKSLEQLLVDAYHKRDRTDFEFHINKYLNYIDGFVSKRKIIFEASDKFKSIFGDWTIDEPQDILSIANIDLIFSNLFLANNEFTLIDYEWVFDFEIPKSYVIWRSFYQFISHYNIDQSFFNPESFLRFNEDFLQIESKLSELVNGREKKYFLSKKVKKSEVNLDLNNFVYTSAKPYSQFFINYGEGYNEQESIIFSVENESADQFFDVEIRDKTSIKSLRFDPLNKPCIVEIKKIILLNGEVNIDLIPYLKSNACLRKDKFLYFDSFDSNILIEEANSILVGADRLIVEVKFHFIGERALQICIQNIVEESSLKLDELNRLLIKAKEDLELEHSRYDSILVESKKRDDWQNQIINDLSNHIVNLEKELFNKNELINRIEIELNNRINHILGQEQSIKNLSNHIGNLEKELLNKNDLIKRIDVELNNRIDHILVQEETIKNLSNHIGSLEKEVNSRVDHILGLDKTIGDQSRHINKLELLRSKFERSIWGKFYQFNHKLNSLFFKNQKDYL